MEGVMAKRLTVFYSWQSDSPSNLNRSVIERALQEALKRLHSDAALENALREVNVELDKDTQGVAGSPPIAETILQKIKGCAVFVADLSFVGESKSGFTTASGKPRQFPNPNVLLEWGYALSCHSHIRLVGVMNTAYGKPDAESLPFDLRHLRWPITYQLADSSAADKNDQFEKLVETLVKAVGLILTKHSSPDEIAEMGKEAARVVSPDVSLEFEFAIEAWEEHQFGGSYPPSGKPKITERDYLKIYAVNHKGGLAQYLQGSVWIPMLVLIEVLVERHISPPIALQEIEKSEPYEVEISNKYSDGPSQQFMKPPPPDWHPFSPGKRLWLKEFQILRYRERLSSIACSIRWQISVNGGDLVVGETKFADIPLVDRRSARRH
jgi:hypothetical protein